LDTRVTAIEPNDSLMKKLFTSMSESDVVNFELEMLPRNSAKKATDVSLTEAVSFVSKDFGRLFTGAICHGREL
jgi:hypothetical protein